MVELRPMALDDVALLVRWDDDPDVAAALGGRGADWYDWPEELARDVSWRELLIAEEDGRPIGFVQLIDAAAEETHYWGDIESGTWALDVWIGAPGDRGRGLGSELVRAAADRCVAAHGSTTIVVDPLVTNHRAIACYRRVGFEPIGERVVDGDVCLVMRMSRRDET